MMNNTGAKEAVFLINGSRFLHLREAGRDVGYATYDVGTGEQLENGLIPYKHLPPDEKYKLQAARNWYLFELSDFQAPVVIQQESVNILKKYPASGVDKRIMCGDETIPKDDVRIIAGYDYDIHRVPNGSVINIDFPNGNVVSEIVNHVDDCHLSVAGIDLVFNIREFYQKFCVEAGAVVYPEFLTQETKAAWKLIASNEFIAVEETEDGWWCFVLDDKKQPRIGKELMAPELTVEEAREVFLEELNLRKGRRIKIDYDELMNGVFEQ